MKQDNVTMSNSEPEDVHFDDRIGPLLSRQKTIQKIKDNPVETNAASTGLIFCCNFPIGTAAVIIAFQYGSTSNACAEKEYLIDLFSYLYVVGCIQIIQVGIFSLNSCLHSHMSLQLQLDILKLMMIGSIILNVFYIIWAAIGLYIYDVQMSESCQNEPISEMLLASCVFNMINCGAQLLCVGCTLCMLACAMHASEQDQISTKEEEESPLCNAINS